MSSRCAAIRDLAPEFALGALDGGERAEAVAHLAGCADCCAYVARLGDVGDALLLALPEADPPAGFETRVLRAVRRRPRRRVFAAVVAAAAALVVVVALVAGGVVARREPARALYAGVMVDEHRHPVGYAAVYGGGAPFVSVRVDDWGASGDYDVVVVTHDRRRIVLTGIRLVDGRGAAGAPLTVPVSDVRAVWVSDQEQTDWCTFRLAGD